LWERRGKLACNVVSDDPRYAAYRKTDPGGFEIEASIGKTVFFGDDADDPKIRRYGLKWGGSG
jgi:hypothetical protein